MEGDDRGRCPSALRHDHQGAVTRGKPSGINLLYLSGLLDAL